ncbi:MAG: thioredoxin family protein [Candidatus Izemoplasmataceae bacterium]
MMKLINSSTLFETSKNASGYHVFVFVSDWCIDCHYLMTFMHHIEALYEAINFYEVKRETLIDITKQYRVDGVPSFLVFKDGTLINHYIDKRRKTFIEIKDFLDNTLKVKG